jgi:ketosteroid isomerase-like protein
VNDKPISSRTPEEVYASHGAALMAEDLDALAANFAEDAVIITPAGVKHGKDGARENFTQLFADLPQAEWDMKTTLFGGEILFLEWSATSEGNSATHGVDTFVIRDGLIRAQTVRYALSPNSR